MRPRKLPPSFGMCQRTPVAQSTVLPFLPPRLPRGTLSGCVVRSNDTKAPPWPHRGRRKASQALLVGALPCPRLACLNDTTFSCSIFSPPFLSPLDRNERSEQRNGRSVQIFGPTETFRSAYTASVKYSPLPPQRVWKMESARTSGLLLEKLSLSEVRLSWRRSTLFDVLHTEYWSIDRLIMPHHAAITLHHVQSDVCTSRR